MIKFLITLSISTIRKNEQEIYFETIESANTQQISRPHPLPFCADTINAWSLRSSIKFLLLICATTTIMKTPPRSVLKNRSFANSCSLLVIMKVQKIPMEEITFSECTLSQSTTLLKSELLHRCFSKFSTISKEQWFYLKVSRIAWEKDEEGEVGWPKFIKGGYHNQINQINQINNQITIIRFHWTQPY